MGDHPVPCVCDRCWSGALDGAIASGLRARLIASFDEPRPPRRKVSKVSRKVSRVSVGRPRPAARVDQPPPAAADLVQQKDEPPPLVAPTVDEPAAAVPDLAHEVPVPPREPRRRRAPIVPVAPPPAAKTKRLRAIARFGARLERRAAAAERAADPIADVGTGEDLVERLERVPEVDDV